MIRPRLSMIVALGSNRAIGKKNGLLWHIPEDLKHFKELTTGHLIIMGRKTFTSIGKVLPQRVNIVITRDKQWKYDNVIVVHSLEEALERARNIEQEEIFIIGGGEVYAQALSFVDRLYLTLVEDAPEAEVYFPPYETLFTKKISEEVHTSSKFTYRWITLEK